MVASVAGAILVADFLVFFDLLIDLRRRRLIDHTTGLTSIGEVLKTSEYGISTLVRAWKYEKLLHEFPTVRGHTASLTICKRMARR